MLSQRTRKLIGAFALLAVVVIYPLLVIGLSASVLPQTAKWLHPFLYILAGFAWVPFAGLIVSWMHGGRRDGIER
jgi:hypothetical protein